MTVQSSRRRPPALVTRSDEATEPSGRHGEDLLRQWDPEAQLVGALMHLSAPNATPILNLVPDKAIWRPDNRWAIEIIRDLAARNVDPDPVTVLHTARRRGPTDTGGARVGPRRHHRFAVHLADLYTQTVAPVLVHQYAREVLDNAFCRAVAAHGARLADVAESGADRTKLAECVATMRSELAELWRCAEAARPAVCNP